MYDGFSSYTITISYSNDNDNKENSIHQPQNMEASYCFNSNSEQTIHEHNSTDTKVVGGGFTTGIFFRPSKNGGTWKSP